MYDEDGECGDHLDRMNAEDEKKEGLGLTQVVLKVRFQAGRNWAQGSPSEFFSPVWI